MENMRVSFIDFVFIKCKNLQKINTINIFYSVDVKGRFSIKYTFYYTDLEIWKSIFKEHINQVDDYILYLNENVININDVPKNENYYLEVLSKDVNLYRNINLIPFLEKNNWNNMDEQILLNSWENNL